MKIDMKIENNRVFRGVFLALYYLVIVSTIYVMAQELEVSTILAIVVLVSTLLIKQLIYIINKERDLNNFICELNEKYCKEEIARLNTIIEYWESRK